MQWDEGAATDHLLELASEHHIHLEWISHWQGAMAFEAAWMVYIPPPTDLGHYLIALHEIGHLVGTPEPDEADEGRAWLWATRAAAAR